MYQNNNSQHRYQQQWAFLTRRLQRWVKSGAFTRFKQEKQQKLLENLRRLYRQMLRFQTAQRLRKALGAATVLLGLAATAPTAHAQVNFAAPQINPFGLTPESGLSFDALGDLDGDGDLDILSLVYEDYSYDDVQFFVFRENQGSSTEPQFAAPDLNAITIELPEINGNYLNPVLADLDGDGDLDIMVGAYSYTPAGGSITYFENTGSAESPAFSEPQINPFGLNYAGSQATLPTVADLDGDGDLDVISLFYAYDEQSEYEEFGLLYIENTGTPTAPAFATAQRQAFNLPDQQEVIFLMTFGDIDNDGDLDLLAGETYDDDYYYENPFLFYENIGDAQNPNFAAVVENPFGLVSGQGLFLFPLLGDFDGDGDLDVLHGQNYDEDSEATFWAYQENLLLTVDVEDQLVNEEAFVIFPTVSDGRYQLQLTDLSNSAPLRLRIFNNLGQLVREAPYDFVPTASFELDISSLPAGVYQVELTQEQQRWVRPVVKQ